MSISHGKATEIFVNGYDLTGYLNSCTVSGKGDVAETSVFGLTSKTYIPGLKDGTLSIGGLYDSADGADVAVLNTALAASANQIFMVFPQGDTIGNDGWGFSAISNTITISTDLGGAVMVSGEAQSSIGAELGVSLHALGAEVGVVNSASVNAGAATTAGGSGYIQATASTALTTATIKIQDSADNSIFADILTFTAITATPATQRAAIAGTIRQYVRSALTVLTGTSITYAVLLHRD